MKMLAETTKQAKVKLQLHYITLELFRVA